MTTLQEAAMRQSFETWAKPILGDNPTWKESGECELAWQSWKAALAQQGEPVAQARLGMKDGLAMALSVVELYGMKGDVIYREIAKLRDGIAAAPAPQAQQGEPVCAGCGIPAGDVHMSTCKSGKWPSRVSNGDTDTPAPQAQQGEPEVLAHDNCRAERICGIWCGNSACVSHTAAPAPQPAQGESLNLAREVLKLNALWNKSTVQAPEISDQLGICRVLAERVNTDD